MISTLTQRYKDDGLARMLASAKQDEAILSTVIHWESAQRYYWKSAGKTEDDVFKLLKLDEAGTNVLKSPILQTWRSYVRDFVGKNPNSELLRKLKASYGDVGLAKMIIMSKNDKTGRPTATELEKLLFDGWKKDKAQVGDVFKLLRLNEEGGTLLKNPVLQTWVSFVEMRKKNPYELLFLAIRSGRYDEAGLTRMITAAKNDRITGPIAVKLEELQLKNWLKQEKSSEEVFKLLGLGLPQNRDNMFTNPAWNTWDTYLARKFESDQVMFNVLRTQLGDQTLTKMVAKAITVKNTEAIATRLAPNIWWMNKQSSDDVFKLLNLDKMDKKLFESPEIIYWVQYVNKLDDFKSHPDNFMMVNKLQKLYGNYVLARMLAMAKRRTDNSQSMKDTVLYLQKMQFNQWMLQKKTPTKIRYQLRSSKMPANENAKVFRDFKAYYKDNIHSLNLMVAH
ncbi:RxLR effector protein [Phytophthora megakarya]|uniref:RxLR effector protein n=1 Tax=Phytophthora megakarya TaxID=4795 RepID=A0A225WGL1_9STRA|nr:RxLR effector protein [Phytophthora megakarya]